DCRCCECCRAINANMADCSAIAGRGCDGGKPDSGASRFRYRSREDHARYVKLAVLLRPHGEDCALGPLRIADHELGMRRMRNPHRLEWYAHLERVAASADQRIGIQASKGL